MRPYFVVFILSIFLSDLSRASDQCVGFDFRYLTGQSEALKLNSMLQNIENHFGEGKKVDLGSYEVDGDVSPLRVFALIDKKGFLVKTRVISADGENVPYKVVEQKANGAIVISDGNHKLLTLDILHFSKNQSGTIQIESLKNKSLGEVQVSTVRLKATFNAIFAPKDWSVTITNTSTLSKLAQEDDAKGKRDGKFTDVFSGVFKLPLSILDHTLGTIVWNTALSPEGQEKLIEDKVVEAVLAQDKDGKRPNLELFVDSSNSSRAEKLKKAEERVRIIAKQFSKKFTPRLGTITNKAGLTKEAYRMFTEEVVKSKLGDLAVGLSEKEVNSHSAIIMSDFNACLSRQSTSKIRDVDNCVYLFKRSAPNRIAERIVEIYFKRYFAASLPEGKHNLVKDSIRDSLSQCAREHYFVNYDRAEKNQDKDFDFIGEIQACVYNGFMDGMRMSIPFAVDFETKEFFKENDPKLETIKAQANEKLRLCLQSNKLKKNDGAGNFSILKTLDQEKFVSTLMNCKNEVVYIVGEEVVKKEIAETKELLEITKNDPARIMTVQKQAIDNGFKVCFEEQIKSKKDINIKSCKPLISKEATLAAMRLSINENVAKYFKDQTPEEIVDKQEKIKNKLINIEFEEKLLNAYKSSKKEAMDSIVEFKVDATREIISEYMNVVIKENFPEASESEIVLLREEALKDRKTNQAISLRDELQLVYSLDNEKAQNKALNKVTSTVYMNATANLSPKLVLSLLKANKVEGDIESYQNLAQFEMNRCLDFIDSENGIEGLDMEALKPYVEGCKNDVTSSLVFSIFKDNINSSLSQVLPDKKIIESRVEQEKEFLDECLMEMSTNEHTKKEAFRVCPILSASKVINDVVISASDKIEIIKGIDKELLGKEIKSCTQELIAGSKASELKLTKASELENKILNYLWENKKMNTALYKEGLMSCLLKSAAPNLGSVLLAKILDPEREITLASNKNVKLKEQFKAEDLNHIKSELNSILSTLSQNIEKIDLKLEGEKNSANSTKQAELSSLIDKILLRIKDSFYFEKDDFKDGLGLFKKDLAQLLKSKEQVSQDDILNLFYNSALGRAVVRAEISKVLREQLGSQVSELKLDKVIDAYGGAKGIDGKLLDRLTSPEMMKRIFLCSKGEKLHQSIVDNYLKPLVRGESNGEIPLEIRDTLSRAILADFDELKHVAEVSKKAQEDKNPDLYKDLVDRGYYSVHASEIINKFAHLSDREIGFVLKESTHKQRFTPETQLLMENLMTNYADPAQLTEQVKAMMLKGQIKEETKKIMPPTELYKKRVTEGGFSETFFDDIVQKGLNDGRRTGKAEWALFFGARVEGSSFNSFNWNNSNGVGLRDTDTGKEQYEFFAKGILRPKLMGGVQHPDIRAPATKGIHEESTKQLALSGRIARYNEVLTETKDKRKNLFNYLTKLSGNGDYFSKDLEGKNMEEVVRVVKALSAHKGLRFSENPLKVEAITEPNDLDLELYLQGRLLLREKKIKEGVLKSTADVDELRDQDADEKAIKQYQYVPYYGF
jgi:hypothetical protein